MQNSAAGAAIVLFKFVKNSILFFPENNKNVYNYASHQLKDYEFQTANKRNPPAIRNL
jgi:hypothetical protein